MVLKALKCVRAQMNELFKGKELAGGKMALLTALTGTCYLAWDPCSSSDCL